MKAYTYLIGWSKLNKWYYGVRYAKGCDSSELWISYFTSSKFVKTFRRENGEPDVIEIRKIFEDVKYAQRYEKRVLQFLKVTSSIKWLNEGVSGYPGGWNRGHSTSEDTKQKIALRHKNKKRPDWVREKLKIGAEKRNMSIKHGRWACNEIEEIQIYDNKLPSGFKYGRLIGIGSDKKNQVIEMLDKGIIYQTICDSVGVGMGTVSRIKKELYSS